MQVSRLHRVTHTGILSTASSTAALATASANALCSSTARLYLHRFRLRGVLAPEDHLADSFLQPLAVGIRVL